MEAYVVLKLLWWALLGILLIGIGVMVGMDMGVGTILRYVGRNDGERRVAINVIGPHWDGNQVWFILGGGAIFAAWPLLYATSFSGFYIVMLVLLWAMIVRPLGFEYRSKTPSDRWRGSWDLMLFISGFVPMLVFGAAIGNVLQGVPFGLDWRLTSYYTGSFIALFNPFAILCGAMSVALAVTDGRHAAGQRRRGAGRRPCPQGGDPRCPVRDRVVQHRWLLGVADAGLQPSFSRAAAGRRGADTAAPEGRSWCRRAAGEFRAVSETLGAARDRLCRHGSWHPGAAGAAADPRLVARRARLDWRAWHGGGCDVPLPDAVQLEPLAQPDRLEFGIEPDHPGLG